jgi:hypothetical protein
METISKIIQVAQFQNEYKTDCRKEKAPTPSISRRPALLKSMQGNGIVLGNTGDPTHRLACCR